MQFLIVVLNLSSVLQSIRATKHCVPKSFNLFYFCCPFGFKAGKCVSYFHQVRRCVSEYGIYLFILTADWVQLVIGEFSHKFRGLFSVVKVQNSSSAHDQKTRQIPSVEYTHLLFVLCSIERKMTRKQFSVICALFNSEIQLQTKSICQTFTLSCIMYIKLITLYHDYEPLLNYLPVQRINKMARTCETSAETFHDILLCRRDKHLVI